MVGKLWIGEYYIQESKRDEKMEWEVRINKPYSGSMVSSLWDEKATLLIKKYMAMNEVINCIAYITDYIVRKEEVFNLIEFYDLSFSSFDNEGKMHELSLFPFSSHSKYTKSFLIKVSINEIEKLIWISMSLVPTHWLIFPDSPEYVNEIISRKDRKIYEIYEYFRNGNIPIVHLETSDIFLTINESQRNEFLNYLYEVENYLVNKKRKNDLH